jgi:hypothetical protein
VTRSLSQNSRRALTSAMVLAALLFSASCGKSMMQQGDGSSYLIVDTFVGASGATPAAFTSVLQSSVSAPDDLGKVQLRMALKDQLSGLSPTESNTITITSYDVTYEVLPPATATAPTPIVGAALTATISSTDVSLTFVLLPQAKKAGLAGTTGNARVTFHGHDQAGHTLAVSASIYITFVA